MSRPSALAVLRLITSSNLSGPGLEIQWRAATIKEAKAVVTQYHKYLKKTRSLNQSSSPIFCLRNLKTAVRQARDQSGGARPSIRCENICLQSLPSLPG